MATSSKVSDRLAGEINKLDVWSVFSPASGYVPKDSLNLGQGFMNWAPPAFAQKAADEALARVDANHYSLPKGRISLRKALSKQFSASFNLPDGRLLDPETEVAVTSGANVAILSFMTAFVNPGDEVLVIEPFFDQYIANISFNGGVPVYVAMRPPKSEPGSSKPVSSADWKLDIEDLKKAITSKTRAIILNTPHNPIGKVFTKGELIDIGNVAKEHDLLICSDEVYDCLAFAPTQHVRIASLEDFWNRTVTIGSAGKSFACTGWRVGWALGPKELIRPVTAASTRITFSSVSPLQEAVAGAFENQENFFEEQNHAYVERRQTLTDALDKLGLSYTVPDGAYFIFVDITRLSIPKSFKPLEVIKDRTHDWYAAWFIASHCGVVCIPPTDFYSAEHAHIGANYIRLAFCKDVDTLKQAGERLLKLKEFIQ